MHNAYAPQEDDDLKRKVSFWSTLEEEIIVGFDKNCLILIQMDANAKVGSRVIKVDPNHQSENGKLMIELLQRQNLYLLNGSDRCEGVITRYRKTINSEEKAVLDYAIGCSGIFHQLQEMLIDDKIRFY